MSDADTLGMSIEGSEGGVKVGAAIVTLIGAGAGAYDCDEVRGADAWRGAAGGGADVTLKTRNSAFGGVGGAAFPCMVAAVATPMIEMCAATLSAAPPVRRCRRARDSSSVPNMWPPSSWS